jgi:hypothetical protein
MKTRANINNFLVMLVFLLATLCTAAAGGTIYVDAGAPGPTHDGTSWVNAYKYLQEALAFASSGDEIWVAEGTYKPDENTGNPGGTGYRQATFHLKNGVGVYGGFAGDETSLDERDCQTNETILSGDLAGNDVWVADSLELLDEPTRAENSYHVVTSRWHDETAVLDGFTISGGNANQEKIFEEVFGGGMYNYYGSPTVRNCTFSGNSARFKGGGMCNETIYSKPIVTNCTFSGNSAGLWGGGMCNWYSSPIVTNCTFTGNSGSHGAGMDNYGGWFQSPYGNSTVTNCTFIGNSAVYNGGGMWNSFSNPTVTNCTFSDNSAVYNGGGMWNSGVSLILTNCTLNGNSAGEYGGGMYNHYGTTATVTNCILWGDNATTGQEIAILWAYPYSSTLMVSYTDVDGGKMAAYVEARCTLSWGDGNIDADPLFADSDLRISAGSPCINAGSNAALPPDTADLDSDGDTTESVPLDLDGKPRIFSDIVDMGAYEGEGQGPSIITVEIDIKPGSYPSSINLRSKGVTPVAIHTTPDFDATTVDLSTVQLNLLVAPLKWESYDCDELPNPLYGDPLFPDEPEMIGDGDIDLVLYFDTQELALTGAVEVGDEWAILTGKTTDGTPIEGMGDVNIVVKGKP